VRLPGIQSDRGSMVVNDNIYFNFSNVTPQDSSGKDKSGKTTAKTGNGFCFSSNDDVETWSV